MVFMAYMYQIFIIKNLFLYFYVKFFFFIGFLGEKVPFFQLSFQFSLNIQIEACQFFSYKNIFSFIQD
jgi:hypothetical protein